MINRLALFISLLSLFYYYCKDDSGSQVNEPININLLESPTDLFPNDYQNYSPETIINLDTSTHYISGRMQDSYPSSIQKKSVAQKY